MRKNIFATIVFSLLLAVLTLAGSHSPWDGTVWDITSPDPNQPIGNSYKEIYDLRKGVAIRANREHTTYASSSAGGVHKNGSAVTYYDVNEPTYRPDGTTALDDNAYDKGRLWLDDNYDPAILKRWDGSAWEAIGIYTAMIQDANVTTAKIADANITTAKLADDAVTTAKIADANVTAALLASNAVTTAKIADANVTVGKINFFVDEDDMASDSAVKVPSQQSVKAYVLAGESAYAGGQSAKMPNGLIIKMGHSATPSGDIAGGMNTQSVSFSSAFPNAVIAITSTLRNGDATTTINVETATYNSSVNGFTFLYKESAGAVQNLAGFDWIAIGY